MTSTRIRRYGRLSLTGWRLFHSERGRSTPVPMLPGLISQAVTSRKRFRFSPEVKETASICPVCWVNRILSLMEIWVCILYG